MKHAIVLFAVSSVLLFSGCSSLMHPKADEFYTQAKGETGKQTALALLAMMETSVPQAKKELGESPGLDNLHNQFHAFHNTFCEFTEQQSATTAFEQAYTINKELKTVFHRLWKFKDDTALRGIHLDLFSDRLQELKKVLQSIPS
jgi:outer membrane murein-binding lipoprotein Lpp